MVTKKNYPLSGTRLRRFLDAMLTQTMYAHPEFLQEPGNRSILQMVEELRVQGNAVEMVEVAQPTKENPGRHVAFYFIGDFSLDAHIGEDFDG